jgi:hypothetical protein
VIPWHHPRANLPVCSTRLLTRPSRSWKRMAAQNCQQSHAQLLRPESDGRQASAATRLLSSFPSSCGEIRSAQRLRSCATRITVKTSRASCRPFWKDGLIARNHNFIITELRNHEMMKNYCAFRAPEWIDGHERQRGSYYPFWPRSRRGYAGREYQRTAASVT